MNPRQRYVTTLTFGNPDKIPFMPGGGRESTRRAWAQQGLPPGADVMETLYELLGIEPDVTQPTVPLDVDFRMIPQFEEKVLEHRDGHYIVQDWMGAITEISDEYDYTYIRSAKDFVTRKWHKFPVENRDDWEQMKWRYDVDAPGRFPDDFERRCQALVERDWVVRVQVNGPFWQLREWCGFEGLCMMLIDDPDFVTEMAEFWTEFVSATLARIPRHATPDVLGLSEDMAYKAHSMISPAMAREFLQPAYLRWVKQVTDAGCPLIDMDSDGYIAELIPLWIEAGINVCSPIEVAAHNDIVEFRRRFGTQMAYHGGIDKRAMAKGGEVIRQEMERVIPPLLEEGGFIPGCDHGVPPDVSWPNFVDYARLLAQYCGWL